MTEIICTAKVNGANQNYKINLGAPPFIRMATFGITEEKGVIRPFGLLRLKGTTYKALQGENFVGQGCFTELLFPPPLSEYLGTFFETSFVCSEATSSTTLGSATAAR